MDELDLKRWMHVIHVLFWEIEICDVDRWLVIFRNKSWKIRTMNGKLLALYCKPIFKK